jgi:hypothetical protein
MYKRCTFGASCPPLRSRFGVIEKENEKIIWITVKMKGDERHKTDPKRMAYCSLK